MVNTSVGQAKEVKRWGGKIPTPSVKSREHGFLTEKGVSTKKKEKNQSFAENTWRGLAGSKRRKNKKKQPTTFWGGIGRKREWGTRVVRKKK